MCVCAGEYAKKCVCEREKECVREKVCVRETTSCAQVRYRARRGCLTRFEGRSPEGQGQNLVATVLHDLRTLVVTVLHNFRTLVVSHTIFQMARFEGRSPESQGQNLAVNILYVPSSFELESASQSPARRLGTGCEPKICRSLTGLAKLVRPGSSPLQS